MAGDARCIAVFDSGIGGLTVVRALRARLPHEDIVYFGDTARVPYGSKSQQTVLRFARENCEFLLRTNPKLIVAACNTASAAALPELEHWLDVPIVGVVAPGARAAAELARGGMAAVIATEATVSSDAYPRGINAHSPDVFVVQKACPLLVPLVEEGRQWDDPIVMAVVRDYLAGLVRMRPRVIVLGCTHYPLLREAIARAVGPDVLLVDSGEHTAQHVEHVLRCGNALTDAETRGMLTCFVSDNPQRFREIGRSFLGEPVLDVTWISPEQFASVGPKLVRKTTPSAA